MSLTRVVRAHIASNYLGFMPFAGVHHQAFVWNGTAVLGVEMISAPYISCRTNGLPKVTIVLLEAIIDPILEVRIWVLHFHGEVTDLKPSGSSQRS